MKKALVLLILGFGAVVLMGPTVLMAQVTTGALVGTVTDEAGGLIPGAEVSAVQVNTGLTKTAVTNYRGDYQIAGLPVGTYDLSVELPGFKKEVRTGIELNIQADLRVDVRLQVGEVSEEITVEAQTPVVESEKMQLEQRVTNKQIEQLPLNNRSTMDLMLTMTPGIDLSGGWYHPVWPEFIGPGARAKTFNYQVEGKNASWSLHNGQTTAPPVDSVAEFTVKTSSITADGGLGLIQVQQAIKQGSNQFHGSAYEYYRGHFWDARDTFNPGEPPGVVRNQFGFSLGGPIVKDKTFFFTNLDYLRLRESSQLRKTHPTALERAGDFSASGVTLTDPGTGQPFPGNIIPRDRWHPASVVFDEFIPTPNLPGTSGNAFFIRPQPQNNNVYLLRLDHELNDNHRLMGLARLMYYDEFNWASSQFAGQYYIKHAGRDFTLRHDWAVSPTVLNQLSVGTNLMYETIENENSTRNVIGEAGLSSFWNPDWPGAQGGFIDLRVRGYSTVKETTSPRSSHEFTNTIANDFSYLWGDHSLKVGGSLMWGETEVRGRAAPKRPRFDFRSTFTGHSHADFLLGLPTQATIIRGVTPSRLERSYYTWYVQDNWRVTSNLNLNMGLRYEMHTAPTEQQGRISTYDFANSGIIVASMETVRQDWIDTGIPIRTAAEAGLPDSLRRSDRNNFAPRLGFAYRVFGDKTVLRGGYGWYFFPNRMAAWPITAFNNPPFASNISYVNLDPSNPLTYEGLESVTGLLGSASIFGVDSTYKDSLTQQMNLTIEQDLGWDTGVRISYVGSRSTSLPVSPNFNQAQTVTDPVTGIPTLAKLDPNFANLRIFSSAASAWYNAMEFELRRRFSRGLTYSFNWTWAKHLSEVEFDSSSPQNAFDLRSDYADFPDHRRHFAKANVIYDLPFGHQERWLQSGWAAQAFGGWRVTGIGRWGTGRRIDPRFSSSGNDDIRSGRPDLVSGCDPNDGPRTPELWFDVNCYTVPTSQEGLPPSLRFGNASRNLVVGPGFRQVDLSLQKSWQMWEKASMTFRFDAYNAFNHANLGNPSSTLGFDSSGQIFSTFGSQRMATARKTQFSLRIDF